MKKILFFALLCALCSCSSGNSKKNTAVINLHEGQEWVDLGLPSGLKWAKCNVGASAPEECGDYFSWGETTSKSGYYDYNYDSMLWQVPFNDFAGDPEYDAAAANWGGDWRMPTRTEFEELMKNCTWTWTSQNGNNGYQVTGTNGQSIFLPAAGYCNGTNKNEVGVYGYYWGSTPDEIDSSDTDEYATILYFLDGYQDVCNWRRYDGRSVRPVFED